MATVGGQNGHSRWTKTVAQPILDKDKNGARRQWMRKGQTPPKSEPKTTKNAPFASLPPDVETAPLNPSEDKEKAAVGGQKP